jgi:ribonuclease VapC
MNVAVDASALLAIYLKEGEGEAFKARIITARTRAMSPVNYWEVMVRARFLLGDIGVAEAELLIESLGIHVEGVTEEQARLAVEAYGRFGKGHPARLNMGDCFAYALSKAAGAPLLFKGADFPQTDVSAAL